MVKLKLLKRRCDIESRLKNIGDRSEKDQDDQDVELTSSANKKVEKDLPKSLTTAKKTSIFEAKLRAVNRREIPPHVDNRTDSVINPSYKIAFGVKESEWKNRMKLKQNGKNFSRFGIEYSQSVTSTRKPAFLLGNDNYGFLEEFEKRPRPRKGYQTLAALEKRWIERKKTAPSFLSFAKNLKIGCKVTQYPKQSPFNTSGERFPDQLAKNETLGPAFYDLRNISIGRRVTAQHKLGRGAILPPPFHIYCSFKKDERCHMCQTEVWCLPTYYAIPGRKIFLCPLCYFVERKMAITLKPTTIAKFKRVIDCSVIHTHIPDSDRVLTFTNLKEIKWLAKIEHYMHLYYPKDRDAIPQSGVRRYAAP